MSKDAFTKHAGKTDLKGVKTDKFGNPLGSEFDLAKDGAYRGFTIVVLQLYHTGEFDFELPEKALKEKGFDIIRWTGAPPIKEFEAALEKACQLWIISNSSSILKKGHINTIKNYFDAGNGVYIWGDNDPYFFDANVISKSLFGIGMHGDLIGNKTMSPQKKKGKAGFLPHLITTGLNKLYEGITIATIQDSEVLSPLMYGSANNLVLSVYDHHGKRALIDGGFTKLYCNWDTAGTDRYVKNAAAWLANFDQWGRGSHNDTDRSISGRILAGEESPLFYYYLPKKNNLNISGFWEKKAKVQISIYNPEEELEKEEIKTVNEHEMSILDAAPGIWAVKIKFIVKSKKEYSYVLSVRVNEN